MCLFLTMSCKCFYIWYYKIRGRFTCSEVYIKQSKVQYECKDHYYIYTVFQRLPCVHWSWTSLSVVLILNSTSTRETRTQRSASNRPNPSRNCFCVAYEQKCFFGLFCFYNFKLKKKKVEPEPFMAQKA